MKKKTLIFLSALLFIGCGQRVLTKPLTADTAQGTVLKICELEVVDYDLPEVSYLEGLTKKCGQGVEAWSKQEYDLIEPSFHPFVQAVHNAYALHRPLSISPDMIWLLIAQGFSKHINRNPEKLRDYFIDFNGKKVLRVKRNGFIKGSSENDWQGVFPEFTKQIGSYTGQKLLNTTLLDFSTTGPVEKAAFEITLMEAMRSYFIYAVYSSCGMTQIKLEGSKEDWELILSKTKELEKYDLDWWTEDLIPVLEKFVEASTGKTDTEFWGQMYKSHGGSGAPIIDGWILKFFPYLQDKTTTTDFPSGMAKADFYWLYHDKQYQMEFIAGFMGVKQNKKTLELRPEIGWAIRDTGIEGIKDKDTDYKDGILNPNGN
jgi:hypothetical protein